MSLLVLALTWTAAGCIEQGEVPASLTLSVENGTDEAARLALARDDVPFVIEVAAGATEQLEAECPERLEVRTLSLGEGGNVRTASYDGAPFRLLERGDSFDCGAAIEIRIDADQTRLTIEASPTQ